jgi:hypothetical protein
MAWYDEYLRQRRNGSFGESHAGQQAGRPGERGGEGDGVDCQVGLDGADGRRRAGRARDAKGLVFAATPASDFICGTLQLAASMNMHIFTTGRGTPYGLAMAPVIKVASNSGLARRWPDLIDVDAGRIATARRRSKQVGWEIFALILDVASGKQEDLGRPLGIAQRVCAVQSGAGDVDAAGLPSRRQLSAPSRQLSARITRRVVPSHPSPGKRRRMGHPHDWGTEEWAARPRAGLGSCDPRSPNARDRGHPLFVVGEGREKQPQVLRLRPLTADSAQDDKSLCWAKVFTSIGT